MSKCIEYYNLFIHNIIRYNFLANKKILVILYIQLIDVFVFLEYSIYDLIYISQNDKSEYNVRHKKNLKLLTITEIRNIFSCKQLFVKYFILFC